jgi:hypothetical protein
MDVRYVEHKMSIAGIPSTLARLACFLHGRIGGGDRRGLSPDGTMLASASWDQSVRWACENHLSLTRACGAATTNFTDEEWKKFFGDQFYRLTCQDLPISAGALQADKVSS